MSTASDTTIQDANDPVARLSDFSDRLSPIVVKEMRQGLRQASFVILFLFLQSILAMAVISSLIAVSSGTMSMRIETGKTISGFFFVLFAIASLIIQPLRGLNCLSSEIKDSTIDLLLLTKLDAWRIVFGKWLSLITQSALLLVAIIPYLMMRYFLGGMNLLGELLMLLVIFLLGGAATAAAVGMSAVRSVILRSIFAAGGIIGFIVFLQAIIQIIEFSSMRVFGGIFSPMSNFEWALTIIGGLLLIAYLTHSFLEFGATRIAPPSENRSARKRIISIAAIIIIPLLLAIPDSAERAICYFVIAIIAPLALADALSENPHHVRPMKRAELWILRPGWPSGSLFALIMLVICLIWTALLGAMGSSHGYSSEGHTGAAQVIAIILLIFTQPVILISLFRPYEREPANLYMASMLGMICLGLVMLMIGSTVDAEELIWYTLFPVFPVLAFGTLDDPSVGMVLIIFFVSALYLAGAAAIGYRRWNPATGSDIARPAPIPVKPTTPISPATASETPQTGEATEDPPA